MCDDDHSMLVFGRASTTIQVLAVFARSSICLAVFLGVASWSAHAQMEVGPHCTNKVDYPALGFTVCRPARDKEQPLDPTAFHPNAFFRIPGEMRAPHGVVKGKERGLARLIVAMAKR